jgi:hypothetical protein
MRLPHREGQLTSESLSFTLIMNIPLPAFLFSLFFTSLAPDKFKNLEQKREKWNIHTETYADYFGRFSPGVAFPSRRDLCVFG